MKGVNKRITLSRLLQSFTIEHILDALIHGINATIITLFMDSFNHCQRESLISLGCKTNYSALLEVADCSTLTVLHKAHRPRASRHCKIHTLALSSRIRGQALPHALIHAFYTQT